MHHIPTRGEAFELYSGVVVVTLVIGLATVMLMGFI